MERPPAPGAASPRPTLSGRADRSRPDRCVFARRLRRSPLLPVGSLAPVLVCLARFAASQPAEPVPPAPPFAPLPAEGRLVAERLTFDLAGGEHHAEEVQVTAGPLVVSAASADLRTRPWRVRLHDARLRLDLPGSTSWSAAGASATLDSRGLEVRDGVFSRCPLERAGWRAGFARACAGREGDVEVEDAVLRLFDVPVLWTPWALLRFGRAPGLLAPQLGSRRARGPFLRLAAYLPAGELGDFDLAVAGFPLDDVDLAAGWSAEYGRVEAGAARLADEPRLFVQTGLVVPVAPRGGFVSRGLLAQPGFSPDGAAETSGAAAAGTRPPSIRADRFVLLGGDSWVAAAGIGSWQPVVEERVGGVAAALPRVTLAWAPGWFDDVLRLPGAARLAAWRPLAGLFGEAPAGAESADPAGERALVFSWRQSLELAPPLAPGLDLRPWVVAAGRHDEGFAFGGTLDRLWLAAGMRAALAVERSWNGGVAYHRAGLDVRYLRVLPVGLDPLGDEAPLGPGPDLLRVGMPQTLRRGSLTATADAWWELRRLDAWEDAAVTFGAELELQAGAASVAARLALDGAASPAAAAARASLPLAEAVGLDLHYAWLGTGAGAAGLFLPWERRLAEAAGPARVVRHGLGGDLRLGAPGSRASLLLGAEFDLVAPRPAALRFGLSLADPNACIALELAARFWLDDPVPDVSLGVRL